jgi:predicted amidophosphoribosyltransferase
MIPSDPEKFVPPKMKLSSTLAEDNMICDHCNKNLDNSNALVMLEKNTELFKITCNHCLKTSINNGQTLYYDSYEVFVKRRKIGMIEQLYQELINNNNISKERI